MGLVLEVTEPMALAQHPIGPPYDASSALSLVALVGRARNLIEPIRGTGDTISWSRFATFVDTIADHFRRISKNPVIASSALMYSLNLSVRQIVLCLLDESRRAREANSTSLEKLDQTAKSLMLFYGWVAYQAKTMDLQRTCEAAESLGMLALRCLDHELDDLAVAAVENIASLGSHGAQKISGVSVQQLASALLPLRWVRRLAQEMDRLLTLNQLDKIEQKFIAALPDPMALTAALDNLEDERWEKISRGYGNLEFDELEALLVHLLNRRRRNNSE